MRLVKLGLASVNTTVGAFGKNVDRAVGMAKEMAAQQVTVALFPEQLVGGYPQEDLVQWQRFVDRQWIELERFAAETQRLPMVSCLGVTVAHQGLRYNCAAVVAGGTVHGLVPKEKLPTYNIFYEGRTFARGTPGMKELHRGVPLGDFLFSFDFGLLSVEVCEDIWSADGPMRRRAYSGAELVCNLSSSPFRIGVDGTRRELMSTRAGDHQVTVAYVNQVGAQDGLVFDGGGYVNQNGRLAYALPRFQQTWGAAVVDLDRTLRLRTENTTWRDDRRHWTTQGPVVPTIEVDFASHREALTFPVPAQRSFFLPSSEPIPTARDRYCEDLLDALALGVGDYYEKTRGFKCIGIALVASISRSKAPSMLTTVKPTPSSRAMVAAASWVPSEENRVGM